MDTGLGVWEDMSVCSYWAHQSVFHRHRCLVQSRQVESSGTLSTYSLNYAALPCHSTTDTQTHSRSCKPKKKFSFPFNHIHPNHPAYPAQLANPSIGDLAEALSFDSSLSEEEENFIIIRVFALRNSESAYELGFWKTCGYKHTYIWDTEPQALLYQQLYSFQGQEVWNPWLELWNQNIPLSHRESCCSVRMEGFCPRLRNIVKSLPIRSVATPEYSSSPRSQ